MLVYVFALRDQTLKVYVKCVIVGFASDVAQKIDDFTHLQAIVVPKDFQAESPYPGHFDGFAGWLGEVHVLPRSRLP